MMLDELPGGVFLAPLASVRDPDAMLDAVMRALDLRSLEGDPAGHITARLRDRPTLLVLDNFEQLLHAGPVVSQLVGEAPNARVLVTSQAALRVVGESVMGLDALALDAAAELFVQRAGAVARNWSPSADDRETILEICRRVGCLPLAVELAAARASVLAPAELLSRLEKSSDILRGGARDAPERQRSLRATFEWTYGLLEPSQRALFRRLGAFAGPVALDTIEAVCETVDDQPVLAVDALERLLDFSLVAREENTTHGRRFTMPQTLRDFARAELVASAEAQAVRRRHAEHIADVAKPAQIWFAANHAAVVGVLAREAEVRPALAWAAEHDSELYRRLVSALALGLIRRGQVREALEHTTRACVSDQAPRNDLDAWLGNCRAYALLFSGRLDEAESLIDPVIAFYRKRGDARGLGLALHTAGWVAGERGHDDSERMLVLARESLDLLRTTGDPALADRGISLLIQVLISMNAIEEAEQLLTDATESIIDPESDFANAVATMRGDTALARGDAPSALPHFAESLQLAARRGDRIQVVNDAYCVAHALALAGRPHAALEAAGAAAALGADSGYVNPFPAAEEALAAARVSVEPSADELIARGRNLPAAERVARLLALAET
jgi:predicted ATPase